MECIFLPKSGAPREAVRLTPPPTRAVPFDRWPEAFRYYARRRSRPGDVGLGDILERDFGHVGGRLFKKFWKVATGLPCGCIERRDWLNARYPLTENVVDHPARPDV